MSKSTTNPGRRRQGQATTKTSSGRRPPRQAPTTGRPKLNVQLTEQFRELRLPMFREHFESLAERAIVESLSHTEYLSELTALECQARRKAGSRV